MNKTKCLVILCELIADTTVYSCLATSGISVLEELILVDAEYLGVDAATALSEYLMGTTSLKRLDLMGDDFPDARVCTALVEGLERNRSLEKFQIDVNGFGNDGLFRKLLRALQNQPNLRSLYLSEQHNMSEQAMEVLREWFSSADCRLEELSFLSVQHLPAFNSSRSGGKAFENKTLHRLLLVDSNVSSNELGGLCNGFPNLKELTLMYNNICDLSPLESILSKEDCQIQELYLNNNDISYEAIMKFSGKIKEMKSLRRLGLQQNPFLDEIALQPLLNRLNVSKSLEQIRMNKRNQIECGADAIELCHTLNVNRGGRHGIEVESANRNISAALWPRILHRASSMNYFFNLLNGENSDRKPLDKSPRAAVVYSLLRDNAYIFYHCGKGEDENVPSSPAPKKHKVDPR
ncbi:unnamed protein product [Cylindrotheca closterium]|uniref:Uncharacterized protein n=1 Tax=Cylindrotheca closterium TaxID=2856 RepID=A0AAD2FI68_9STRA|nr:unnamed protein product [Cylindrotheca closterium]